MPEAFRDNANQVPYCRDTFLSHFTPAMISKARFIPAMTSDSCYGSKGRFTPGMIYRAVWFHSQDDF